MFKKKLIIVCVLICYSLLVNISCMPHQSITLHKDNNDYIFDINASDVPLSVILQELQNKDLMDNIILTKESINRIKINVNVSDIKCADLLSILYYKYYIAHFHSINNQTGKNILDCDATKILLHQNKYVDLKFDKGYHLLHYAVMDNDISIINYLIDYKKVNADIKSDQGVTPFFYAVYFNYIKAIDLLLSLNVDINHHELKTGSTPLHIAAMTSNINLMKYLIEKGADPYSTNSANDTAIDIAIRLECTGIDEIIASINYDKIKKKKNNSSDYSGLLFDLIDEGNYQQFKELCKNNQHQIKMYIKFMPSHHWNRKWSEEYLLSLLRQDAQTIKENDDYVSLLDLTYMDANDAKIKIRNYLKEKGLLEKDQENFNRVMRAAYDQITW